MKTKRNITEQDVKNFFSSSINSIEDAMGIIELNTKEKTLNLDFNAVLLLRFDEVYSDKDYSLNCELFDIEFQTVMDQCLINTLAIDTEYDYIRHVKSKSFHFTLKLEKKNEHIIKIYLICLEKLFETEQQLGLFSNVVGAGTSMFTGSTWWIDYDREPGYFYTSDVGPKLLGMTVNKNMLYKTKDFQKVRQNARIVSEFYEASIQAEENSFERVRNNLSDYFAGRTPTVTANEDILWVEAYGKCLIRYPDGRPRLFVALDIYMSDIFEKTNQLEIIKNLIDYGLISSQIGVWYHQRHFLEGKYYFTESYQRLMTNQKKYKDETISELLDEQIAIMKAKGNGHEHHLYDFRTTHNSIYTDGVDKYHIIIPHQKDDETLIWLDVRGTVIERDEDGNVILFVGVNVDVTESYNRNQELERLRIENERLQLAENLAVQARGLLVWYMDEEDIYGNRQIFGNSFFEEKLGLTRTKNGLIPFSDLMKTLVKEDKNSQILLNELHLIFSNQKDTSRRILAKHRNLKTQEIIYLEHSIQVNQSTTGEKNRIIGGILLEVTESILYQEQIKYLANNDTLTDTKNRNYFEGYIKNKLPSTYSVLIFDIDGLKLVNDAFGHYEGDRIIIQLGDFLKDVFVDCLFISRIGGDEFVVLTSDVDQISITAKANQLEDMLSLYNKTSHIEMIVSKGGISIIDNDIPFDKAFVQAENIMYRRKLNNRSSRKSKVLESILETLNAKTEETKEHSMRMSSLAVKTIIGLGMSRSSEIEDIKLLSKVHDIGKITIHDQILHKPGKLTNSEFEMIKKHCEAGYKITRNITDSDNVCNGVLLHHERWDGTGYPQGLKGDNIPIFARVISVVDTYDAITNDRVYQSKKSKEVAIKEIIRCSGTQFDPYVVKVFLKACFDIEYDYHKK